MKKKVYIEKYETKNDDENFENMKETKGKEEIIKIKSKKKEVK